MIEYDDSKEECIIVDVDGTLSHISDGRLPDEVDRAMNDEPDDAISIIVAMAYRHGYRVIIVTGRKHEHRDVTIKWLEENGIPYDELYTRTRGNRKEDYIVKRNIYKKYIEPRFNVKFVLEDRNQCVDMWRELGLKALQVAYGNF